MYKEIPTNRIKLDVTLGYLYFLDKNHPLASRNGKTYYHRHVASLKVGRWLNKDEIVHHIDGCRTNNTFENLEILSAQEHSKLHGLERVVKKVTLVCQSCGKSLMVLESLLSKRKSCSEDCRKRILKFIVDKDELEVLIWNLPYTKIAERYGVSDVAVKKRAKSLGCLIPPRYFFSKSEEYRKQQRLLNKIHDLSTQDSSKVSA